MEGLAGLLTLVTFTALLAPYIAPDRFWPPLFAAYAFVYLFLAQILLLVLWLRRPDRGMWLTVVALLLSLPALSRHVQMGGGAVDEASSMTIATFNTHALQKLWDTSRPAPPHLADPAKIASLWAGGPAPDLLCLQEVPRAYHAKVEDWGMPGADIHRHRNSLILSRFPILERGKEVFPQSNNEVIWVDVETPGGLLRVYNAHLQSNSITAEADSLVQAPINAPETWQGYRSVLGRVKRATRQRAEQSRWLADHAAACPYPVLIAGDFNDTPQSYSYRQVARHFKDSFMQGGSGFGTTFAGTIPGLRIDYVFGSDELAFISHRVPKTAYSDHYPVIARFVRKE
jgi:endonuclease/exonuclease/phosphatase family metal-dependent hydrolase